MRSSDCLGPRREFCDRRDFIYIDTMRTSSKHDPCVICNATPTVKSHYIPRAIAHELRGDDPHLHVASRARKGSAFSQSGIYSYGLLCSQHEEALNNFDRYGIEMIRYLSGLADNLSDDVQGLYVENSDPYLFQGFALACLWRTVNSEHGREYRLSLGSHENRIRQFLFDGVATTAPVFVSRTRLVVGDLGRSPVVMLPYKTRMKGLTCWLSILGSICFYVIIDQREPVAGIDNGRADKHRKFAFMNPDPLPFDQWRALRPLVEKIRAGN